MLNLCVEPKKRPNNSPVIQTLINQLANIKCCCKLCTTPEDNHLTKNEEVQVEDNSNQILIPFDKHHQIAPKDTLAADDKACPTCNLTLNLLRDRLTRVLKDEETATVLNCSNKSTEILIDSVDKTTSVTSKPVLKYSAVSLYDNNTDYDVSDGEISPAANPSLSDEHIAIQDVKRNSSREVTFLLDFENDGLETPSKGEMILARLGSCVCFDDIIDSIRPPL